MPDKTKPPFISHFIFERREGFAPHPLYDSGTFGFTLPQSETYTHSSFKISPLEPARLSNSFIGVQFNNRNNEDMHHSVGLENVTFSFKNNGSNANINLTNGVYLTPNSTNQKYSIPVSGTDVIKFDGLTYKLKINEQNKDAAVSMGIDIEGGIGVVSVNTEKKDIPLYEGNNFKKFGIKAGLGIHATENKTGISLGVFGHFIDGGTPIDANIQVEKQAGVSLVGTKLSKTFDLGRGVELTTQALLENADASIFTHYSKKNESFSMPVIPSVGFNLKIPLNNEQKISK